MALAREIMGFSLIERSSFLDASSSRLLLNRPKNRFFVPRGGRRVQPVVNRAVKGTTPVAAIIEDLDLVKVVPEKAVKFKVRAVVTVRNKNKEDFNEALVKHLDSFADKIGRNVVLELISNDIDPKTKAPKKSNEAILKDWSKKSNLKTERVNYTAEFVVDSNFGVPGAITVANKHQQEFFIESITIEGFACGPVHFPCNSWVQPKKYHPGKRIFFSNQPYLPHETPAGLKALREKELRELRGDGKGERKLFDRIYDFDVYNDLGNPDKGIDFARPILGGEKIPYPRRCRTGRAPTDTDLRSESRVEKPLPMYVPRDEQFEESKMNAFSTGRLKAVLHNLIPSLMASISANNKDFKGFSDIDSLYSEGLLLKLGFQDEILKKIPMPKTVNQIQEGGLLKYNIPKIVSKDKYAWLRDDEFARQALAGVNPVNIERLQVFPPVSKLDPEIYGPKESALKEEHIAGQLNGMTVQEALDSNKLYIIDYHDIYLPFIERINSLDGRKSYATRTSMPHHTGNGSWRRPTFVRTMLAFINLSTIGMAVPDPTQPHGLRLMIEDYPYASDGLMIWSAIQDWVHGYVRRYYRDPADVCNDRELQAWYAESVNVGHADLRHADWWPALDSPDDLASVLTTLVWLASAQHAALNFGQYPYGGYVPNRPPLVRRLLPGESDPEHEGFVRDPQKYFFSSLPSLLQATKFMAVVDTLSTHSPDEEYIGERQHGSIWSGDSEAVEAFYEFSAEIGRVEKEIERRNADPRLRNRCGAGVLPYELLAPSSEPGVTCRGVPNSVSI
ncbi:lipoxygenase [Striga asiatica]|uniref:Lipoxygenase n=1 Tax=Striga asiatica TaxID=4170 RepID=A0A5A7P6N1_STRAF|nr:lipoxygenase [Striga asiatica]